VASLDEWLADATGSYVLQTPPLSGGQSLLDRTGRHRRGETLLVSAARGTERLSPAMRSSMAEIIDCTPGGSDDDVGSPADLTGISMPLSEFLKAADAPAVGFDSVSTLLFYTEVAAVFRFLSVLTAHLRRNDGLGLFVLTPQAHEERTVRTLAPVFDGRIELAEDDDRIRIDAPNAPDALDVPEGWRPR
jgi:KaiC/GvpD/RAD55 family RecA-like ATPase